MASVMAIVSKAIFEKEAKGAKAGDVYATARYKSTNKRFETLAAGGALFLVTVRPSRGSGQSPDAIVERLWLVAILESPAFADSCEWRAAKNRTPIVEVTKLVPQLRFETGAGIQAKKGALAMSLQTPRILAEGDVVLLRDAAGAAAAPAKTAGEAPAPDADVLAALRSSHRNLAAHDDSSPLPCLCKKCFDPEQAHVEMSGMTFVVGHAEESGRVLFFWMPVELAGESGLTNSVREKMKARLKR